MLVGVRICEDALRLVRAYGRRRCRGRSAPWTSISAAPRRPTATSGRKRTSAQSTKAVSTDSSPASSPRRGRPGPPRRPTPANAPADPRRRAYSPMPIMPSLADGGSTEESRHGSRESSPRIEKSGSFFHMDMKMLASPGRGEVERPARGQGAPVPARPLPGRGGDPDQPGGNGRLPDARWHSRAAGDSVPSRPRVRVRSEHQSGVADAAEALDAPQGSGRGPRAPRYVPTRHPASLPTTADPGRHVTLMPWA